MDKQQQLSAFATTLCVMADQSDEMNHVLPPFAWAMSHMLRAAGAIAVGGYDRHNEILFLDPERGTAHRLAGDENDQKFTVRSMSSMALKDDALPVAIVGFTDSTVKLYPNDTSPWTKETQLALKLNLPAHKGQFLHNVEGLDDNMFAVTCSQSRTIHFFLVQRNPDYRCRPSRSGVDKEDDDDLSAPSFPFTISHVTKILVDKGWPTGMAYIPPLRCLAVGDVDQAMVHLIDLSSSPIRIVSSLSAKTLPGAQIAFRKPRQLTYWPQKQLLVVWDEYSSQHSSDVFHVATNDDRDATNLFNCFRRDTELSSPSLGRCQYTGCCISPCGRYYCRLLSKDDLIHGYPLNGAATIRERKKKNAEDDKGVTLQFTDPSLPLRGRVGLAALAIPSNAQELKVLPPVHWSADGPDDEII